MRIMEAAYPSQGSSPELVHPIPDDFVGDEPELGRQSFSTPVPPPGGWRQLDDVVLAYRQAADVSEHRFKLSYTTSGHSSKKLCDGNNVIDHATLYCRCPRRRTIQSADVASPMPHRRSWCTWNVKFKLDKSKMEWVVISRCDEHCCEKLPDYSITATGMRMLRNLSELQADEIAFIHDQFENVGTYPRLIQWNFSRKFPNRKPTSDLISSMRLAHDASQYGLADGNVKQLRSYLETQEGQGGVGRVEWDEQLKISRVVVCRHDMIPYLNKYQRVLICDATHGITMSKFRLFTIVVVDSLLHSALVAYAIVRSEAADALDFIFEALNLNSISSNVVFVTDDNPAARIISHNYGFRHILCQWHYAKNWIKKCNEAKVPKKDQLSFGNSFYDLLTSASFSDDEAFDQQLMFFCEEVTARAPGMLNWCNRFMEDRKLACEHYRKGIYCAGMLLFMFL